MLIWNQSSSHRVTANALSELRGHYKAGRGRDEELRFTLFLLRELLPLVELAVKDWIVGGILQTR